VSESAKRWSLSALKRIVSGGLAFVDFLGVVLIAPIVAFYLLLDWDRLIATIDSYLPRQSADTVRDLARQIDKVLSGFLRGQLSVCLILVVGGQVGLHPVWLIFALSAFGTLFGFAGLLIAVPAAAAIGVLVRWGLQLYQQSGFYTGKADEG